MLHKNGKFIRPFEAPIFDIYLIPLTYLIKNKVLQFILKEKMIDEIYNSKTFMKHTQLSTFIPIHK